MINPYTMTPYTNPYNSATIWKRTNVIPAVIPVEVPVEEVPVGFVAPEPSRQYNAEHRIAQLALKEKPVGFPLLPYPKDKTPPSAAPNSQTAGHWITINPGSGAAPVWGFMLKDTGLPLEGSTSNQPGHYVSVHVVGTDPFNEAWAWVPEVSSNFGLGE
jgi:hypothetical protein